MEHVTHAERLTPEQRDFVVDHIRDCPHCCDLYGVLCDLEEALREAKREAAGIPKQDIRPICTAEEAFARDWQRIQAYEAAERKKRRRTLVFRIGGMAAAACIVIAIGVWFVTRNTGTDQQPPIAANGGSPAVFAELVTPEGRKPLALNQPIATDSQPQEILLGGMHRVVMNRNTKATFAAAPIGNDGPHAGKVPYEIQLAQGELYVEVVPGNPFTVKTHNARLDITGTEFDVLADGEKTELTLLKGSIRFSALEHPQEPVSVTAGHASIVTSRRAPTAPTPADAVATVAWAREETLQNAIVSIQDKHADDVDQMLMAIRQTSWQHTFSPSDLDKLHYEKWRNEHRQGKLALTALAALPKDQSASADWIELLMISGDIWEFHYDPKLSGHQPLTKLKPQAITRLARHRGLDEKEILKALSLPDSVLATTTAIQDGALGRRYVDALCRWHDAILATVDTQNNPKPNDDLKTFSFQASRYLSETRIAAYLWVKNHPDEARQLLTDKEYRAMLPILPAMSTAGAPDMDAWLKQLRKEATSAHNCIPASLEWLAEPPTTGCTYQATEQQHWLAELVAELTPPDQREGKER